MDATPTLTFTVDGQPVPQPRPRISTWGGRGRAYTPAGHAINPYRQAVAIRATLAANAASWKPVDGPVRLDITCLFQRPPSHLTKSGGLRTTAPAWPPRVDVDNLAKGVQDAITDSGAVWVDDDQVVQLVVSKCYAAVAGTVVTVKALRPCGS